MQPYTKEEKDILRLTALPGMTARRFWLLHAACPRLWPDFSLQNERMAFLPPAFVKLLLAEREAPENTSFYAAMEKKGMRALTYINEAYPKRLLDFANPPPVLYAIGDLSLLRRPLAAMVGPRRPSETALAATGEFARCLAQAGAVVLSGMAAGIDAAAHRAALSVPGGKTVAVLGSGADRPYPAENAGLHAEICQKGLVLSEQPPGAAPLAGNFPLRNRIISGLSDALVLMEAGAKSGALITASFALEQGKPVLCLPNPANPQNSGVNDLIRSGCKPALEPADVLRVLGLSAAGPAKEGAPALSGVDKQVYESLLKGPRSPDEMAVLLQIPAHRLNSVLTMLEVRGIVEQLPGRLYKIRK